MNRLLTLLTVCLAAFSLEASSREGHEEHDPIDAPIAVEVDQLMQLEAL